MAEYVNNKELLKSLIEHKKNVKRALRDGDDTPRVPEYVGKCIYLICTKLSSRYNFIGYSFKDDMVGDGIENCVSAVGNFDPKKSSYPFTYFSIVAFNAFVRRIQRESKQSYIKHKNAEMMFTMIDDIFHEANREQYGTDSSTRREADAGIRNHYEVIRKFEESLTKRRTRGTSQPTGVKRFMGGRRGKTKKPAPTAPAEFD